MQKKGNKNKIKHENKNVNVIKGGDMNSLKLKCCEYIIETGDIPPDGLNGYDNELTIFQLIPIAWGINKDLFVESLVNTWFYYYILMDDNIDANVKCEALKTASLIYIYNNRQEQFDPETVENIHTSISVYVDPGNDQNINDDERADINLALANVENILVAANNEKGSDVLNTVSEKVNEAITIATDIEVLRDPNLFPYASSLLQKAIYTYPDKAEDVITLAAPIALDALGSDNFELFSSAAELLLTIIQEYSEEEAIAEIAATTAIAVTTKPAEPIVLEALGSDNFELFSSAAELLLTIIQEYSEEEEIAAIAEPAALAALEALGSDNFELFSSAAELLLTIIQEYPEEEDLIDNILQALNSIYETRIYPCESIDTDLLIYMLICFELLTSLVQNKLTYIIALDESEQTDIESEQTDITKILEALSAEDPNIFSSASESLQHLIREYPEDISDIIMDPIMPICLQNCASPNPIIFSSATNLLLTIIQVYSEKEGAEEMVSELKQNALNVTDVIASNEPEIALELFSPAADMLQHLLYLLNEQEKFSISDIIMDPIMPICLQNCASSPNPIIFSSATNLLLTIIQVYSEKEGAEEMVSELKQNTSNTIGMTLEALSKEDLESCLSTADLLLTIIPEYPEDISDIIIDPIMSMLLNFLTNPDIELELFSSVAELLLIIIQEYSEDISNIIMDPIIPTLLDFLTNPDIELELFSPAAELLLTIIQEYPDIKPEYPVIDPTQPNKILEALSAEDPELSLSAADLLLTIIQEYPKNIFDIIIDPIIHTLLDFLTNPDIGLELFSSATDLLLIIIQKYTIVVNVDEIKKTIVPTIIDTYITHSQNIFTCMSNGTLDIDDLNNSLQIMETCCSVFSELFDD